MEKVKVFIINLERSEDRKNFMQEQIQKLFTCNPNLKNRLEFEFFKAVDDSKMNICSLKVTSHGGVNLCLGVNLAIVKNHALHLIIVYGKNAKNLITPSSFYRR